MSNVYKCRLTECIDFDIKANSEEQAMEWLATHTIKDVLEMSVDHESSYNEEVLYIEGKKSSAQIDISADVAAANRKYVITNIEWYDGDDADNDLPEELIIDGRDLIDWGPYIESEEEAYDGIVSYLSEKYDAFVSGLEIQAVSRD